jgi:enolase
MKILDLKAMKQLSSMGNETIKVRIWLQNGTTSSVVLPAGISAGKYEVRNIPAADAISEVEHIAHAILNKDWEQGSLDTYLVDQEIAGNSSLAISAAFWKAMTIAGKELHYDTFPKLNMLLFEGGKHGNPNLTIQEFMLIEDSIHTAIDDYKKMRQYLESHHIETTVGAEGGFSPMNFTNRLVLELIKTVFPGRQVALDAAGSFKENQEEEYESLFENYNIYYLEDPYSDEDWKSWATFFAKHNSGKLLVGDDLTVTNADRIQKAIDEKAIGGVIIKPNQNGTISGTLQAVDLARKNGLKIIVSHRGEETSDDWIVDFALQVKADYVKFGGINRGERIAKYNRLLTLGMK